LNGGMHNLLLPETRAATRLARRTTPGQARRSAATEAGGRKRGTPSPTAASGPAERRLGPRSPHTRLGVYRRPGSPRYAFRPARVPQGGWDQLPPGGLEGAPGLVPWATLSRTGLTCAASHSGSAGQTRREGERKTRRTLGGSSYGAGLRSGRPPTPLNRLKTGPVRHSPSSATAAGGPAARALPGTPDSRPVNRSGSPRFLID